MQDTERKQRSMQMIAYFPSSSFRSYSSVKRVVVVMMLANGLLLVTVAMLLVDMLAVVVVVVGGDTFVQLLSALVRSLFPLFVLLWLKSLLSRTLLYFIQSKTWSVDQERMSEYEEVDVGPSSWETKKKKKKNLVD